jgi:NADH-quinone oxidoreductase subunit G
MKPVGMCRMCLVEVGRPVRDRATGELVLEEDGSPKIGFGPKLETACTVQVAQGMVVRTNSEKVQRARKDIIEFLLTSHPLDCPICDKGGECPLQNLTLAHGPGQSRFLYEEKIHLDKHVPLGDLIYLDRERCILCSRCVRFQEEVVGDPVIGFFNRGRRLEIVTFSEPGFDSYFSGNTTDICPVGALTTADFRFGARPWEMRSTASICPHCSVGCNITLNIRREARLGGDYVIKRVMPRQNEWVNEIWICDKGRFGHHFVRSEDRLTQPMLRKDGKLVPVSWDEALETVAAKLSEIGAGLLTLVSGRLSNEDLFNLKQLTDRLGGTSALYTQMGGGDLVAQYGLIQDSNLGDLGSGDAILVVACDLEEEAPIWWLRVKQAAERGATLIVVNPRPTKTDRYATHMVSCRYGEAVSTVLSLTKGMGEISRAFTEAENAVIFFGSDGLGLEDSQALAAACAKLLVETGHVGRPNNGLIAVWQRANDQGAWEMGFRPLPDLAGAINRAEAVYLIGADLVGDDSSLDEAIRGAKFLVVQELFLTETASLADVVLPAQAFAEREGSLTSGERRVQRFYPGLPPRGDTQADFAIAAMIAERVGISLSATSAAQVMAHIAEQVPAFAEMSYARLAEVVDQWPIVCREDLHYGGTSYQNFQGLGVRLRPMSEPGPGSAKPAEISVAVPQVPQAGEVMDLEAGKLLAVPITRLYDRGQLISYSEVLHSRLPEPFVWLHPKTAATLGVLQSGLAWMWSGSSEMKVRVQPRTEVPREVFLVPRSMGFAVERPTVVTIRPVEVEAVSKD